ncbi:hypothetical protein COK90_08875 [Priestia megaterium]|uniref:hypothetical protein n=1 Tax=Priestia megaterium TaxID=1404 RepID=UPI000BF50428|nr:hypothetical protein [Priestia megaterium]PFU64058.1 hypothetical protein COK90_08875 [Priestia megaterium]
MLTSLTEDKQSHVVLYGANIGQNKSNVSMEKSIHIMLPERYRADNRAIELSLGGSLFKDKEGSVSILF